MTPGSVPFQLFYEEIQSLRETMLAQHRSQREAIDEGFANLGAKFEAHEKADQVIADKVLLLEERQRVEKELKIEALDKANRRSTLISSVVAIAVTIVFKALDWLRHAPTP